MVNDLDRTVEQETKEELAAAGEELAAAVGSDVDASALSDDAAAVAEALGGLTELTGDDLTPELEARYRELANAGDAVVSHLVSAGFFEAVDETLPPFDDDFLDACLTHGLGSAEAADSSVFETANVDAALPELVSEALEHTAEIGENVRWEPDRPEKVSPMTTRGATEGVVDWLDDLGRHLWMSEVLLSDAMLADASTHTRGLGSALLLLARGAAGLDGDESAPENAVAEVVAGIALHTYHQRRVPEDLSWITDEMRAPGAWAAG
jgi:hypothetical protein